MSSFIFQQSSTILKGFPLRAGFWFLTGQLTEHLTEQLRQIAFPMMLSVKNCLTVTDQFWPVNFLAVSLLRKIADNLPILCNYFQACCTVGFADHVELLFTTLDDKKCSLLSQKKYASYFISKQKQQMTGGGGASSTRHLLT